MLFAKKMELAAGKKLIKSYSQIAFHLAIGNREQIEALRKEIPTLVSSYERIGSDHNDRVNDYVFKKLREYNPRRRKMRSIGLEVLQVKKLRLTDFNRENNTSQEGIAKWIELLTVPGPSVSDEKKNHFRRKVRQLLRIGGFHYNFEDSIRGIPNRSSVYDTRSGDHPYGGTLTRYMNSVATMELPPVIVTPTGVEAPNTVTNLYRESLLDSGAKKARIVSVSDTFKDRILTIHPHTQWILTGLQQKLLTFLGNLEAFFVRKESTDEMLHGLYESPNGFFCSGDYSQATDTFCSDLSEIVLEEIVECISFHNLDFDATEIEGFKRYIIESTTRWLLEHESLDTPLVQRRGQLMGTVLSFPVLNIYNFAVFACTKEEFYDREFDLYTLLALVRVNGDDILFNETRRFIDFWMENVGRYGMTLNRIKSQVSRTIGSLNSRYYRCNPDTTSVSALSPMRSESLYLLYQDAAYDHRSGTVIVPKVNTLARAFFNLGAWKGLRWLFRTRYVEKIELRRFFGPITEDQAMREQRNIERNLLENALLMTGQPLFLTPVSPDEDVSVASMSHSYDSESSVDDFEEWFSEGSEDGSLW